ncbi:biotin--[acetyl-CoA-carboxylase] ligase, partial [Pseudomonas indica]|uniref:biotin--[acetyl-CoA-carboxylase] ligase n=1 Tax=Pseudomonas indica TaxID=137658 RepID=UPI0023F88241
GGVGLKWPNDILVNKKKIAGILLELMGDPADICHVAIGIGINANMSSELQVIDQPWTSLCLELGELIDRNLLIIELNDQLETYLSSHFEKGFAGLRAEWEKNHLWQGRQVDLIAGAQRIGGTVLGINDRGALRLLVDGAEREFSGGELSLRLRNDS